MIQSDRGRHLAVLFATAAFYLLMVRTARYGPWFLGQPVSVNEYRVWQAAELAVVLIVLPFGIGVALARWTLHAQQKAWPVADLLIWIVGVLFLRWILSDGGIWLQESTVGLGQHRINVFRDVLTSLVWIVQGLGCVVGAVWLWKYFRGERRALA